jgi:hypothetical protein
MGQHMVGWALPRNTGRVYAYLLIQKDPASLAKIAQDLGIARSGVSVATRQLVGFGMARTIAARGSRRLSFEALVSLEAILAARSPGASDLALMLQEGASVAPPGPRRATLKQLAAMIQDITDELPALIGRIKQKRSA